MVAPPTHAVHFLRRSLQDEQPNYGGDDTRYHNDTYVEDTNSNIFGTYERGCQISNDPPGDGDDGNHDALPSLTVCNLTAYECRNSSTLSRDIGTLDISFDYELHYNPQVDLNRVLRYYEELSLDHLATELGLKDCESVHSNRQRRLHHRRRRLVISNETQALVTGLSLFPRDRPDSRYTDCIVPVDDSQVSSDSVCVPTVGELTLFTALNPDGSDWSDAQTEELRSTVLEEIRRAMDQDLFLTKRAIEKVSYVGNRTATELSNGDPANSTNNNSTGSNAPPVQTSTSTQKDNPGMSTEIVGLLAAGAVLVLLILAALMVAVRWRRQRGKYAVTDEDPATFAQVPPANVTVTGSLAGRDSLALVPQRFRGIPLYIEKPPPPPPPYDGESDDRTAEVTSWATTPSPPRTSLLLSPNGRDYSLQPPSRYVARHNVTGFDPVMLGLEAPTVSSGGGGGGSLSSVQLSQHSDARGLGRVEPTHYEGVEASYSNDSHAGTRISFEKEMDLSDSESERSARRTLQMT